LLRVERDLGRLGVARAPGAHLLVARVARRSAGVAGHDALDAAQLLERGLETPEAAAGEGPGEEPGRREMRGERACDQSFHDLAPHRLGNGGAELLPQLSA